MIRAIVHVGCVILVCGMSLSPSLARGRAHDLYPFDSSAKAQAFEQLTTAMRCLVCQNQNIADSQAPMAVGLRRSIAKQLRAGVAPAVIRARLKQRYGEGISFAPAWHARTWVLWAVPLCVMLCTLLWAMLWAGRSRQGGVW